MGNRLALITLLTLTVLPAQAMRCGTRLVQEGDTKLEVLNKCGEPTFSEGSGLIEREDEIASTARLNRKLLLIGRHQSSFSQTVETWHYNCGSQHFARVLTFIGPYLERIETVDRGVGTGGCKQLPADTSDNSAYDNLSTDDAKTNQTPRRVLDAAIEFRDLHQRNLDTDQNDTAEETASLPRNQPVYRWQDDQGQWHYSSAPKP